MEEIVLKSQGDEGSKDPVDKDQETDLKGEKGDKEGTAASEDKGDGDKDEKKEEETAPTADELLAQSQSENTELRTLLRDGKKNVDELTRRIEASEAALDKAGLITEEEKKATADQQVELDARKRELDNILESTRLSRKYEDVDTVVSQGNFDLVIDMMASEHAVKNSLSKEAAVEAVEGWVWTLVNPYRFMYEKIKELHPSYKGNEKGGKELPPKSPGSLQDLHGGTGAGDLTGWTAAKIDALAEDKLSTVPSDVYAKYLRNELK